jgi:hypothetical protein
MNWDLILTMTGVMLFCHWFYYVIGSPLAKDLKDIDGGAILFSFPYNLAVRRLRSVNAWKGMAANHIQEMDMVKDPITRRQLRRDHREHTVAAGREFFTWERSILCPICLHFWLTLLVGLVFIIFDIMHARADFFLAALVYLVTHLIIRKIS